MHRKAADTLFGALKSATPCPPVRDFLDGDLATAYRAQDHLTELRIDAGDRVTGLKVGLTAFAAQRQFGLSEPVRGTLFACDERLTGEELPRTSWYQPRIEGEIAFVLGRDLPHPDSTPSEVMRAVEACFVAIEVVDTRIANWDCHLVDMIADNVGQHSYIPGHELRMLRDIDPVAARMEIRIDDHKVANGQGAVCYGSPVNALTWAARDAAKRGRPLQAGQIVMAGALAGMVEVAAGQKVEVEIEGLGQVSVVFAQD